jgi:hypothetical protein
MGKTVQANTYNIGDAQDRAAQPTVLGYSPNKVLVAT